MAHFDVRIPEICHAGLKKSKSLIVKGKHQKAVECLEGILVKARKAGYRKVGRILGKLLKLCNFLYNNSKTKVPYLRKAEKAIEKWITNSRKGEVEVSEKTLRNAVATFANWGDYCKSINNYHMGFDYFTRAALLLTSRKLTDPDSFQYLSKLRLIVSSTYLELQRYQESISFAESSLDALQSELKLRLKSTSFDQLAEPYKKKFIDMICTYVLSFYTISLAQDGLHQRHLSKQALINAIEIGSQYLDKDQILLSTVSSALNEITKPTIYKSTIDFQDPGSAKESFKVKRFLVCLTQPMSECQPLSDALILTPQNSNQKLPGRYYSSSQLSQKQRQIEDQSSFGFISADKYFFQEISKVINVQSDLKHLKPSKSGDSKDWIRQENTEKRVITDLRFRKHYRFELNSPLPMVSEKIKSLKIEDKEKEKNLEKKIALIAGSLECKKIINQICMRGANRKYVPSQSN